MGALEERTKCVSHLPGRWKGGTRPASSGSWLSMEGSLPAPRCRARGGIESLRSAKRFRVGLRPASRCVGSHEVSKRSPSTISREIRRNGGSQTYRANRAERSAWERALRPKPCRLCAPWGVTMARGAEACAAMVARADLWLAEAAVPDRPRHADIPRSDLSQSLCSDARRAEEAS